jgi:pilus assembly protein CpaE
VPLYRDLLELASQRIIVFEPTLAGVRDAIRLRALHDGQAQSAPTIMLLNRLGMLGGLTLKQIEQALESRVDIVVPDMPKRLVAAANMGEPAVRGGGHFRIRVGDLARLVAFNRLLDSAPSPTGEKRREERRRGWRIWKKQ